MPSAAMAQNETGRAQGEVRKVDEESGKVAVRHGPIEGMNMPSMTMVFRVAEPGMLDRLKQGDRILFETTKREGNFTITSIQPSK